MGNVSNFKIGDKVTVVDGESFRCGKNGKVVNIVDGKLHIRFAYSVHARSTISKMNPEQVKPFTPEPPKTDRAATHMGTCQVCGGLQKLPNGKLAKHGYTTRWGFFEGICSGSGHDPYEISKDLIEDSIEYAKKRLASLEGEIEDFSTRTNGKIRVDVIRWEKKKKTVEWQDCEIYLDEQSRKLGYAYTRYPMSTGVPTQAFCAVVEYWNEFTPEEVQKKLIQQTKVQNQRYVAFLQGKHREMKGYLAFQQERADGWTYAPEKLVEVER